MATVVQPPTHLLFISQMQTRPHRLSSFFHRHRTWCLSIIFLISLYWIIRLFFTPALLSDTYFSYAYYDRNGTLLRMTLTPDDKYRLFTPLDQISPDICQATILYEDKYFRWHFGVNPISLFRSTIDYFTGRPHPAGASTITMQVARLKYGLNTTSPLGKLEQIALAIYIDAMYSKDEILQAYLNLAPYGGNIEGIGSASLIYFDRHPSDLSKIESITLSTIPQNPAKRGLNTKSGLQHMSHMRQDLTQRWIALHPSDNKLSTLAQMPLQVRTSRQLPFLAPHFTDFLISTQYFHPGPHPSYIYTTLDLDLQKRLEQTLHNQVTSRRLSGVNNASSILVNYKTMETIAYIGAVDYFDDSIFGRNNGVLARRSPGSTLKPLIYASAIDRGFIHPMTLMRDAPIHFGVYAPENADNEFYGPILARDALTHSRNIPAITLVRQIGTENFYKLLSDCGVANLKSPSYYGVSIALGGAEVSMFELAHIYSMLANLGRFNTIRTNLSTPKISGDQLLSPESAFLTLDMLGHQSVPTTRIRFASHQPATIRHYWKTGTSSSYRDAWTAGIFGDYVLITWVGNFDGTPNNAFSGAKTASPIYFALSNTVAEYHRHKNAPIQNNNFLRPDMNITQLDMCESVGGLAGPHCPQTVKSYFIPGVSPLDTSPIYRQIPIDKQTGLRACSANPKTTTMRVYEFWDAEFLEMFRRAGIRRNTPPDFMPGCAISETVTNTSAPIILSPLADTKYIITDSTDTATISFQAISEKPSAKIFWFLDDKMLATTKSGETTTHKIPMGPHTVRISTDTSPGTSINFSVIK